jgi:hypothetical protein
MLAKIRCSVKTAHTWEERTMSLSNVVENWRPVDLIACGMILVCGSLIALGHDSSVTATLLAVSAYYFGHERKK